MMREDSVKLGLDIDCVGRCGDRFSHCMMLGCTPEGKRVLDRPKRPGGEVK